jgi:hypothetical protein
VRPEPPPDVELADLVTDRAHWQIHDQAALYTRPGATSQVRVQALAVPTRRDRFVAAIIRDGRAVHSRLAGSAREAVDWAEKVPLG